MFNLNFKHNPDHKTKENPNKTYNIQRTKQDVDPQDSPLKVTIEFFKTRSDLVDTYFHSFRQTLKSWHAYQFPSSNFILKRQVVAISILFMKKLFNQKCFDFIYSQYTLFPQAR